MSQASRPLLLLHADGALRDAVERVRTRGFGCRTAGGWGELREAVLAAPPAAVVVVDPYFGVQGGRAPAPAPELRALLWEFPSAAVVAALRVDAGRSRDLRALGAWGVCEILSIEEDAAPEALCRRLGGVEMRPLQTLLNRTLPGTISGRARTLLMTTAEVVAVGGKGRDLARRLYLSERSVLRWSVRAGLPPPRRLTAWMRILLAAALLDDPGRDVLGVARACGYASDSSLRRAMRDFLGRGPTALREAGAFRVSAARFLEEIAATRATARGEGRIPDLTR